MMTPSKSELVIRDARSSDLLQITMIYAQAVKNGNASFELEAPDTVEMHKRFETLKEQNYPYLVAELGKQIGGYAYAAAYRSRPAYRWSVENTIYVHPDFHRQGWGTLLLNRLIEKCTTQGFRQMIAIIGDSSNCGSIQLHLNAGFIKTGTLTDVGRKHGKWLDSVIMQRELGAGCSTPPS